MRFWKFRSSYSHYRIHTGYGPCTALYRALYYELRKKEPKYLNFKHWFAARMEIHFCCYDWCLRPVAFDYQCRCVKHQTPE